MEKLYQRQQSEAAQGPPARLHSDPALGTMTLHCAGKQSVPAAHPPPRPARGAGIRVKDGGRLAGKAARGSDFGRQ